MRVNGATDGSGQLVTDPAGSARGSSSESSPTPNGFGALLLLLLQPSPPAAPVVQIPSEETQVTDEPAAGDAPPTSTTGASTALDTDPDDHVEIAGAPGDARSRGPFAGADASTIPPGVLLAAALLEAKATRSDDTGGSVSDIVHAVLDGNAPPRSAATNPGVGRTVLLANPAAAVIPERSRSAERAPVTTAGLTDLASSATPGDVADEVVTPVTAADQPVRSQRAAPTLQLPGGEFETSLPQQGVRARGAAIPNPPRGPLTMQAPTADLLPPPPELKERPRATVQSSEAPVSTISGLTRAAHGEARVEVAGPARAPEPVLASADPAPVEQIVRAARVVLRDGLTQLEIRLEPPALGAVRVIAASGAGGLDLTIAAERPETRALLLQAIPEMQAALVGHGVAAPSIAVATSFEPTMERRTPPRRDGERPSRDPRAVNDRPRPAAITRGPGAVDLTI